MNFLKRQVTTLALIVVLLFSGVSTPGQQRRQTPNRPQAKPATPAEPVATFDTLLGADCYKIYAEVRNVGQFIRSNSVNEILEPIMKLAAPPKEFKSVIKWLNLHADDVMASRMLMATSPSAKDVPEVIFAIEFASPEEAAKFENPLKEFLPKVWPAPTPEPTPPDLDQLGTAAKQKPETTPPPQPKPAVEAAPAKDTAPPKPIFFVKQSGSLLLISPSPLNLKKLRPAGSKLWAEDVSFRMARNRFASESLFVFVDMKGIEREEAEREEQISKQSSLPDNSAPTTEAKEVPAKNGETEPKSTDESTELVLQKEEPDSVGVASGQNTNPVLSALSAISFGSLFSAPPKWPDAIGIAVSFDNDSFDARALLVNAPGKTSDAIPILPPLIPGPAIAPESPSILPANTELFIAVSLDLPQIYAVMSKPPALPEHPFGKMQNVTAVAVESPFAALEKQLNLKIKEDVLPLLGSEVGVVLPLTDSGLGLGIGPGGPVTAPPPNVDKTKPKKSGEPVIALSLRDKEGMRLLIPKIIEGFGMKGAASLAQTERQEDTELVSFAGAFAYAFIGNFLVLSGDPASVKSVVDSYLKHETLANDNQFKNYTRWQPRQLQGQVYVSPALMDSYRSLIEQPTTSLSDPAREIMTRLTLVSQPITYALSNEGLGHLHELHLPKNLVLMAVAGISSGTNVTDDVMNERQAIAALYMISQAEIHLISEKGGNAVPIEQLISDHLVPGDMVKNHGYRIQIFVTGEKFEVTAIPLEYGKTGKMSYFVDNSGVLRAADHAGAPATVDDNPLN